MKKSLQIILLLSLIITGCNNNDCVMKDRTKSSYNGCGDFMINEKTTETGNPNSYLVIEVDRPELTLNNSFRSFQIQDNNYISANINEYNTAEWEPFCTDVLSPELIILKSWNLKDGIAEIRIVEEKSECDEAYIVDLILKEATFTDNEMNEIYIREKRFNNILVNYPIPF